VQVKKDTETCPGRRGLIAAVARAVAPQDEQLMWRVRADGDPAAFARLVERWQVPVQRFCHRLLDDRHRAEDLAQETFARLFRARERYAPTARFSTYLWRIALNLCRDEIRRQSRRPEGALESADETGPVGDRSTPWHDGAPGPADVAAGNEEAALVRQALARLPEQYRSVLVLRHYEHLKLREIADVLDLPAGTVSSRLAEALDRLAVLLAPALAVEAQDPGATPAPARPPLDPTNRNLAPSP
jgi:RNA polymerase sigma-70 factor (ECF subfamily)